jgi:ABC-type transport system substrate-binding protein/class 3 adenylate cyclase
MPPDDAPTRDPEPEVRTFLIADVRGYTRYTQEHGDEAGARLAAAFAELVERTLAGSGGRLVELRGDEALAVFASPRQAIRTAVALQQRFVERMRSDDPLPLRVGIGLDAGEAVPVGDGYRGGPLNLAARLCSMAGPGEVLASEGLAHLARKVDDTTYADRGRVTLKGFAEPVRVFAIAFPLDLPPEEAPGGRRRPGAGVLAAATVAAVVAIAAIVVAGVSALGGSAPPERIDANALGAIDPAGAKLASEIAVGNGPNAAAVGLGSVWVANAVDETISRVDPDGETQRVITGVGTPGGITTGFGLVWVTDAARRAVWRLSPEANTVVGDAVAVGNGPGPVAAGEGAVWVGNTLDGTVSRVDPDPARARETDVVRVAGRPDGIAVGAGGVWVASGDTATVTQIDPAGPDPAGPDVVRTIAVGNGASGIAVGAGAVWVANAVDGTLSRIDPRSGVVTGTSVAAGVASVAIAGGAVWVASPSARTVFRVDPETGRVTDAIDVGSSPTALAAGPGGPVWMAALAPAARHRGGTLTVSSYVSFCGCLDPAFGWQGDEWRILSMLYDGLVAYRKTGGTAGAALVPDLARAVPQPADGGRTYRFELRPGIQFSDGTPVRASDVRASFERLFRLNGINVPPFYAGIAGTDGCSAARNRCDLARGIEADEEAGTVTFHLRAPDSDFLHKLALPFASVLPAGAPGPERPVTDPGAFARIAGYTIPGTGPYVVERFRPGVELRLRRNPEFRVFSPEAQPDGYPDRIVVRIVGDGNAPEVHSSRGDVERGRSDWTTYLAPPELDRLAVSSAAQLHSSALGGVHYLMLNTAEPPFDDVRARRAVAYALDRDRLGALAGGDLLAQPTCQILPPTFPGYRPYCPYTANPRSGVWNGPDLPRARALAKAAGVRGSPVDLVVQAGDTQRQRVMGEVARVLRALGFRPRLHVLADAFGAIFDPRSHVDASVFGWIKDYTAPSTFFRPLFSCDDVGGENVSRFCDPRVDALAGRAARASDPATAGELWARIDRAVVDQAPAVPLYSLRQADLVSARVGNYVYNPQFGVLLDQLWVR